MRIKELRKREGISQAKLAEAIGVSAGNVGEWEVGRSKPGADALIALSRYFKVSADWILTGESSESHVTQKLGQAIGDELSPREIEFIAKFRQLSERDQGKIEGIVEGMLMMSQGENHPQSRTGTSSRSMNGSGREEAAARSAKIESA